MLAASGQVPARALSRYAVFAELSLGGELRGCAGTLAVAEGTRLAGLSGLIVARERAGEAALVEGIEVAGLDSLGAVAGLLTDGPRRQARAAEHPPPRADPPP